MNLIKYTVAVGAMSGVVNAQGLFDVNPNETEGESSALRYTVGVAVGYDDNVNPTSGVAEESSLYARATVGANVVTRGPRTSWDVNAHVGYTNYFDVTNNDSTVNAGIAFNLNHRINNRVRFVSRNFFNYGIDLGNFYGPITSRQTDEYTYFSTDNAIGYRWTDRLATYTGVTYSMLDYDGSTNDVNSLGFYNTFRYTLSPQTVLTATYRYNNADYDSGSRSSQYVSAGFEHKLSDTATLTGDFGAQIGDSTTPYGQLSYSNRITDQLRMRAFARYSQEDTDTVFPGGRYNEKTSLRVGGAADYTLSPNVILTVGGNYVMSDYSDGAPLADADWDLFNVYLGMTYKINDAVSIRGSVNHTTSDSTLPGVDRDYDRNRYEVGMYYSF